MEIVYNLRTYVVLAFIFLGIGGWYCYQTRNIATDAVSKQTELRTELFGKPAAPPATIKPDVLPKSAPKAEAPAKEDKRTQNSVGHQLVQYR
jgi:hypothetical protein